MMKYLIVLICVLFTCSCSESERDKITRLVREMEGKEIVFPDDIIYTVYGTDTVDYIVPQRKYTVVTYVDSIGCVSCKLQLYRWKDFMNEMDSLSKESVLFRFVFHPKDNKELSFLFKRDRFNIPVWIDHADDFYRINNLPDLEAFHTLLLDSENKVIAIGNPVDNPKIKELYNQIILNFGPTDMGKSFIHQVEIEDYVIDMGEFDWREPCKKTVKIKNISNNIFIITDIVTSCGCINPEYPKEPVNPGGELEIDLIYKSDQPEFFNKTLKVYTNADINPIVITVKGVSK